MTDSSNINNPSPTPETEKKSDWRAKASPYIDRIFDSIAPEDVQDDLIRGARRAIRAYWIR